MITVYELGPTSVPERLGASPHVRKVILALKYKSIPFKVVFLLFDKIEETAKSIGAPPTETNPDGSPKYTVPFIQDSTTGKAVSDSFAIAEYLDTAYPNTSALFPPGTKGLQSFFIDEATKKFFVLTPILAPAIAQVLSPELLESRKKAFSDPGLTSEQKAEIWEKTKGAFNELEKYYEEGADFLGGEKPVFVDLALGAMFAHIKVAFGEGSEEWEKAKGWGNGRVGRATEKLLSYK